MSRTFDEPELSPVELRVREAAVFLLDAMDPELRAECEVLAEYQLGMSVRPAGLAGEWLEYVWTGRPNPHSGVCR